MFLLLSLKKLDIVLKPRTVKFKGKDEFNAEVNQLTEEQEGLMGPPRCKESHEPPLMRGLMRFIAYCSWFCSSHIFLTARPILRVNSVA